MPEPESTEFLATSIYGAMTDKPLVRITYSTFQLTVSPNEARRMAAVLLAVAEASEMDAIVYRWMRGDVGATVEQSARAIQRFRTIREQLAKEDHDGS